MPFFLKPLLAREFCLCPPLCEVCNFAPVTYVNTSFTKNLHVESVEHLNVAIQISPSRLGPTEPSGKGNIPATLDIQIGCVLPNQNANFNVGFSYQSLQFYLFLSPTDCSL